MGRNTGNTAREMAAAPLSPTLPSSAFGIPEAPAAQAGADIKTALETAIIAEMLTEQSKTIAPLAMPFTLVGFKLNGKAKDYVNDDKSTTRKVAFAILTVGPFRFDASITVTSTAVTDGEHKGKTRREFACKFPNKGKNEGYKPLFETDNPIAERELAMLRVDITREYRKWAATLETAPERMAGRKHGEDTVVEID